MGLWAQIQAACQPLSSKGTPASLRGACQSFCLGAFGIPCASAASSLHVVEREVLLAEREYSGRPGVWRWECGGLSLQVSAK